MTDYTQKARGMFTPERIEAANNKVARLQCELDITNTDHIALWLEANDPYEGDAWLAVQIADAYDRAIARTAHEATKEAIKRQAAAVRTLQASEATEINILRKERHKAHEAIKTLESERAANALLTDELEATKAELQALREAIPADVWNAAVAALTRKDA